MASPAKAIAAHVAPFWSVPAGELLQRLETTNQGLTEAEAAVRLSRSGANRLRPKRESSWPGLLLGQFKSPLVLILVAAALLSFFLHDKTNAGIILGIVVVGAVLGFWQEYGAAGAVAKLLAVVQVKVQALRSGRERDVAVDEIVPGDVLAFNAGDVVPGDCRVLESKDLFANEAVLTGESFPAEKLSGVIPAGTRLGGRTNVLYMGTHVAGGTGRAVVVRIGRNTEFGKVADRLRLRPPETEFERGLRRFGYLLMEITLILVVGIFAFNVFLKRPVFDSFLFAMALAVGLTPQLLPAIVSVSLSRGAQLMARQKVIVRRLASIENFGSMTVLCSDKTGTLTRGTVRVSAALDAAGRESEEVLLYSYVNAAFQSGFTNPVDAAIRTHHPFDLSGWTKLDEVPYDFVRKRLSVLAEHEGRCLLITKGALPNVLEVCTTAEQGGNPVAIAGLREEIEGRYRWLSAKGLRVFGVAYRDTAPDRTITRMDEAGMTFLGFLVLEDPLKAGIAEHVVRLRGKGYA